jgi:hypothetical protein
VIDFFCCFMILALFSTNIRVNPTTLSFNDLLFSGDHPFSCSRPILEGRGRRAGSSELLHRARSFATMIEPIIIRHFPDIADAQQDLAASLERVVIIADKKEQSELVAKAHRQPRGSDRRGPQG